jgi:hypothetical protein
MWIEDKLGEDCERRTMLGQWHQLVIGVSELAIRGVLCEWMHQTIRPWLAYYLIFVFAHMTIGALLALFANNPLPRFGLEIPPPKGFFSGAFWPWVKWRGVWSSRREERDNKAHVLAWEIRMRVIHILVIVRQPWELNFVRWSTWDHVWSFDEIMCDLSIKSNRLHGGDPTRMMWSSPALVCGWRWQRYYCQKQKFLVLVRLETLSLFIFTLKTHSCPPKSRTEFN